MIKSIKYKLLKVYVDITHIHQESDCESQMLHIKHSGCHQSKLIHGSHHALLHE